MSDIHRATSVPRRLTQLALVGLLLLSLLHWFIGMCPPFATYRLDAPGRIVIAIPQGAAVATWLAAGVLLLLTSCFLVMSRRAAHRTPTPLEKAQTRLTWLTALVLAQRMLQFHFPSIAGNLLFFGAPAVMAWALCGGYAPALTGAPARGASRREWWLVTLLFATIFWLTGWYFTESVGEHSGDEGHYLIQAHSLYHDHDLDLRNDFGSPTNAVNLDYMHISFNSQRGCWYSVHTPGLAFLLAPTVGGGVPLRHLMLGLISGLGLAAFFSLCRRLSRDRVTPVVLLLLLALSTLWGVYSCRALPEVLGAALTVCGVLAVLNQAERPHASLAWLLLICTALPFAYVRFVPIAAVLCGCYGLFELLANRPWRAKLIRLSLLILGGLAGLGAFLCFQGHLYGWHIGLAHNENTIEFAASFAWHSLASGRGILVAFPVFACALPATLVLLFRRQHWRYGLTATLIFLSIFLSWCSSNLFQGGSTLPGRFFIVFLPTLTAALAVFLPDANRTFRGLAFFLGLFSVTIFLTQLAVLPSLHNQFGSPYELDLVHPLLYRLLRFYYDPYETSQWLPALALYGGAGLLLLRPAWPRQAQLALLALMAALWAAVAEPSPNVKTQGLTGTSLWPVDTTRACFLAVGDRQQPAQLWQVLAPLRLPTPAVILRDPPPARADDLIRYGDIGDNDWAQRGYHWATLACPAPAGRGHRVVSLVAQLTGDVAAEFVIREGSHTLVSKTYPPRTLIRDVFTFDTHNNGDLYFLVRLDGHEGALEKGLIAASPYIPALLQRARLTLPTPAEAPNFAEPSPRRVQH